MDKMFAKLMEKKKGEKLPDSYKKAKMGVLESLSKEMSGMMSNDVKGLKKVTVAAKDDEGLKKGLDKAEDLIEGEACADCGQAECECPEAEDEEASEAEEMSAEELEAKIAELQQALKAKQA